MHHEMSVQETVHFDVDYPERSDRLLAAIGILWFVKPLLLLPHLIVMWFLGIAWAIVVWLAYWVVLFNGTYPRGLFDFVVGVQRWQNRMTAWIAGLTDDYPPFRLR
jgi:hypothetical protein